VTRTLALTSPALTGDDVLSMQKLLRGDKGPYADFMQMHKAPVDGVWRIGSAGAAKSAKYALGFPIADVELPAERVTAGDLLRGYLQLQPTDLPADFQARRSNRLAPAPLPHIRERALATAATQIGTVEQPVNLTTYGAAFGWNGVAWCAEFVTWCYEQHDSMAFAYANAGARWAYVPAIVRAAQALQYGLSITASPIPGDVVCYLWAGWDDEQDSHTGIFESGDASHWTAIEGNTSDASRSNGGMVLRRTRQKGDAALTFFVRVTA
jgi:hypothetical protein